MPVNTLQDQIKALNIESVKALQDARALVTEWNGKERPQDVTNQIDAMLAKRSANDREVERLVALVEGEKFANEVDTKNLLSIASHDETGNEVQREYRVSYGMKMLNAYVKGEISKDEWANVRDHANDEAVAFKAYLFGNTNPGVTRHLGRAQDEKGPSWDIRGASAELKTALNEGTAGQGGYLTPDIYAQEIILPLANESWMRTAPRIRQITVTSDVFRLPALAYTTAAVLTTETTAYDEKEPTFTETSFTPYKYTREVKASEEVLEDSRFNVWSELIQPDAVQAFATAENTAFATGTGTSQPEGVTINAPVGITEATGNTTKIAAAKDVVQLYYSLDFKYRNNASWMMNDATAQQVSILQDGQNRFLFMDNINQMLGTPSRTILGRPVVINSGFDAPAANKITIVFGDFNYYVIADRAGLVIKYADQLRAATGQVSWFIRKRFDAHMMNTTAFTALKQSAS